MIEAIFLGELDQDQRSKEERFEELKKLARQQQASSAQDPESFLTKDSG